MLRLYGFKPGFIYSSKNIDNVTFGLKLRIIFDNLFHRNCSIYEICIAPRYLFRSQNA